MEIYRYFLNEQAIYNFEDFSFCTGLTIEFCDEILGWGSRNIKGFRTCRFGHIRVDVLTGIWWGEDFVSQAAGVGNWALL